jgi:hypothetical protein
MTEPQQDNIPAWLSAMLVFIMLAGALYVFHLLIS